MITHLEEIVFGFCALMDRRERRKEGERQTLKEWILTEILYWGFWIITRFVMVFLKVFLKIIAIMEKHDKKAFVFAKLWTS